MKYGFFKSACSVQLKSCPFLVAFLDHQPKIFNGRLDPKKTQHLLVTQNPRLKWYLLGMEEGDGIKVNGY